MDSEDRFEWGPWLVMMAIAIAGIACLFLAMTTETKAQGQALCGQRSEVVRSLRESFQERQIATGNVDRSTIIEVFVSEAGSWTIIATSPDGTACLVSSGDGWSAAGREV